MAGRSDELAWSSKVRLRAALHASMGGWWYRAGEASLRRRRRAKAQNRMSCSVSASVPGARGTGEQIGVVPELLWPGTRRPKSAQKLRQGSVGYPAVSPCACCPRPLRLWFANRSGVAQRSRRHLARMYQVPPVPRPADSASGGEERRTGWPRALKRALRGGWMQHALGKSRRLLGATGRIVAEAPARSHRGQCLSVLCSQESTKRSGLGSACLQRRQPKWAASGVQLPGNGR